MRVTAIFSCSKNPYFWLIWYTFVGILCKRQEASLWETFLAGKEKAVRVKIGHGA